jgi:twinkle protein
MKEFVNDFSDFGIEIPKNKKPNANGDIYVRCPVCSSSRSKKGNSKKDCLGVNVEEGMWGCNHCGWGGHLIDVEYMQLNNIKTIPDNTSDTIPQIILNWFSHRKISEQTLKKGNVSVEKVAIRQNNNPDENKVGEYIEQNAIAFKYKKQGLLKQIKYRDQYKNFRMSKVQDEKLCFYGIDDIKSTKECSILEGEMDKLSFGEIDIWNTVSVPNGATISDSEREIYEKTGKIVVENQLNLTYLDNDWKWFENKTTIYIGTDCDAPGLKLREELARRLGKERCRILRFDKFTYTLNGEVKKCKDANEVLMECGEEVLEKCFLYSEPFPIEDIITLEDVRGKIMHDYNTGIIRGKSIGLKSVDFHFTLKLGYPIVINGYPGNGKTSFIIQLMIYTALAYDWKWMIYSPENYPVENFYEQLIECFAGKSFDKNSAHRIRQAEINEAMPFLHDHFIVIDNENGYNVEAILKLSKSLLMQYGINGICIDPWNNLKHDYNTDGGLSNYLEHKLGDVVRFATRNNVLTVINAHPPTPTKDKRVTAPNMYSISGGAIWPSKMYSVLCIHKIVSDNLKDTQSELHVQKNKSHKIIGIPTTENNPIILEFDRPSGRYKEDIDGTLHDPIQEIKDKMFNKQLIMEGF